MILSSFVPHWNTRVISFFDYDDAHGIRSVDRSSSSSIATTLHAHSTQIAFSSVYSRQEKYSTKLWRWNLEIVHYRHKDDSAVDCKLPAVFLFFKNYLNANIRDYISMSEESKFTARTLLNLAIGNLIGRRKRPLVSSHKSRWIEYESFHSQQFCGMLYCAMLETCFAIFWVISTMLLSV